MYRRSSGLGAVWSADGTDFSYPWYCNLVGSWAQTGIPGSQVGVVAGFSDACLPPTQAQLTAMQKAQLAKIAAVNPAAAAASLAAGDVSASQYCTDHPDECANYNSLPQQGQTLVDYLVSQTGITPPGTSLGVPMWVWLAAAGVGVILIFGGRR